MCYNGDWRRIEETLRQVLQEYIGFSVPGGKAVDNQTYVTMNAEVVVLVEGSGDGWVAYKCRDASSLGGLVKRGED